MQGSLNREKAP